MQTISITCGGCEKSFPVTHPAISSAAQLMKLSIACPHCAVTLKAPEDRLRMEPIEVIAKRTHLTLVN